jgi:hypothetical protein
MKRIRIWKQNLRGEMWLSGELLIPNRTELYADPMQHFLQMDPHSRAVIWR